MSGRGRNVDDQERDLLGAGVLRDGDRERDGLRFRVVEDERRLGILDQRGLRRRVVHDRYARVVEDLPLRLADPAGAEHNCVDVVADHLVRAVASLAGIVVVDADVERHRMPGEPVVVVVEPSDCRARRGLLVVRGTSAAVAAGGEQPDLHRGARGAMQGAQRDRGRGRGRRGVTLRRGRSSCCCCRMPMRTAPTRRRPRTRRAVSSSAHSSLTPASRPLPECRSRRARMSQSPDCRSSASRPAAHVARGLQRNPRASRRAEVSRAQAVSTQGSSSPTVQVRRLDSGADSPVVPFSSGGLRSVEIGGGHRAR